MIFNSCAPLRVVYSTLCFVPYVLCTLNIAQLPFFVNSFLGIFSICENSLTRMRFGAKANAFFVKIKQRWGSCGCLYGSHCGSHCESPCGRSCGSPLFSELQILVPFISDKNTSRRNPEALKINFRSFLRKSASVDDFQRR